MHGHPIARRLEEWHREHNGQAADPEWANFLNDFTELLAAKRLELLEEHSNDGRFGMSKAGGCTRASALKQLGHKGEPFTGSTRVTFFIGHMVELLGIASLRAAGYAVDGSQTALRIDPFMHSYTDGVMPELDGTPALLSVKSAGYKKSGRERRGANFIFVRRGFPELPFEGVRKSQPGHWVQSQAEMHAAKLGDLRVNGVVPEQTLYLVAAKDIVKAMEDDPYLGDGDGQGNGSLTFYAEVIKYDPEWCETILVPTWQRQWNAVAEGHAGAAMFFPSEGTDFRALKPADENWKPNAERTGTFNPCNYCDLLSACKADLALSWRRAA